MDKLGGMDKATLSQMDVQTAISQASMVCSRGENEVVSCQLADEVVLLQLSSGSYYTLDEVGVALWKLIEVPLAFCDIHRELLKLYEVDTELLESDLMILLSAMIEAELITIETPSIASTSTCQKLK